jgi:hypothetical protein
VATAMKRGRLVATKRGGRGGRWAAADKRRQRRREEGDGADAMNKESWVSGGGKQRNNQLTYVNERDSSGRKQCQEGSQGTQKGILDFK